MDLGHALDTLRQDVHYGLRQLRLNPGFTTVAVLSLALGIGANTAIFRLVNAVRLRTLPVENPHELAYVDFPQGSQRSGWFSTRSARFTSALWDEIRTRQEAFSGILAWSANRLNLAKGGEVRYAEGLYVSGDFFRVLGVQPLIGRMFTSEDDQAACSSPAAVLSHAFWQSEFGGEPGILERTISLDGKVFPIVGVSPPSFFGVEVGNRFDVAVPLCVDRLLSEDGKGRSPLRHAWWLSIMGRLKSGWTEERATAHLQTVSPAIMQASLPERYRPDQAKRFLANKLVVTSGAGVSGLRRRYETPLWMLLATTGAVLLIACANLANLLLARATVREKEIAVRLAVGADRGRVIRQLLSESLLLSIFGSVLGAVLAQALSRALVSFLSTENSPLFVGLGIDLRVFAFTAGLAVGTCLLFGLLPAWRATRVAPAAAMRSGGRGLTAGRERNRLRRILVVGQVALSLVLLIGALLFVRSLRNLMTVDAGFKPEGVVAVSIDLRRPAYAKDRLPAVYREMLARVSTRPGVISAAQVSFMPVSGSGWDERARPDGSSGESKSSRFNRIGPGYFKTMGTTLLSGRDFDDRDTAVSPKVAIVNEVFVREIFGGQNPVGRSFRVDGEAGKPDPVYQVIGIVRNTKYHELREDFLPIAFLPMAQEENPGAGTMIVVRAAANNIGDVMTGVKTTVAEVHPEIGLEFRILARQLQESLLRERLMATLSGAFGLLAGLLATVGLYGVIAYMVERRRNEIGVRMALGADRVNVIWLVLREAGALLIAGLVVGTGLSLWAGQLAATMLFGLKPYDPPTVLAAIALLTAVALIATYAPARRASRLDPMNALREE